MHYRPSSQGLHMLADSTGIKFLGEGEWKTKKHGAQRRRQWRKVHLGIDAENMQIRAMVVTTNEVGDSPVAVGLLRGVTASSILANFASIWCRSIGETLLLRWQLAAANSTCDDFDQCSHGLALEQNRLVVVVRKEHPNDMLSARRRTCSEVGFDEVAAEVTVHAVVRTAR